MTAFAFAFVTVGLLLVLVGITYWTVRQRQAALREADELAEELEEAEFARQTAENRATRSELNNADLSAEVKRLNKAVAVVPPEHYTVEELTALRERVCVHCGGIHVVACPRVRRMRFRADGQTIWEIEFWADEEWDKSRVVWPEDLPAEATVQ